MEQKADVNRHGSKADLPGEYPVTGAQKLMKDIKKLRKAGQEFAFLVCAVPCNVCSTVEALCRQATDAAVLVPRVRWKRQRGNFFEFLNLAFALSKDTS